jgi:hypothetical protein
MASTVGNRPAQYRARAQQSREKAATAPTESARKALLRTLYAAGYVSLVMLAFYIGWWIMMPS